MKKKMSVLVALIMAVAVTSYSVSGTYAKYTSNIDLTDEARVAKWDITAIDSKTSQAVNTLDLFSDSYSVDGKGLYVKSLGCKTVTEEGVEKEVCENVVAPGTKGEYQVNFAGNMEVRYMLNIDFSAEDETLGDRDPGVQYGFVEKDGKTIFTKGFGDKTYSPITYKVTLFNGFKGETYGTFEGTLAEVREQMATYNESATTKAGFEPGALGLSCKIEWYWNAENEVDGLTRAQVDELDTYLGENWSEFGATNEYKLSVIATQVAEDHAVR